MRDSRFVCDYYIHGMCFYCFTAVQLDVVLETNKSAIRVLEAVQKKLSQ